MNIILLILNIMKQIFKVFVLAIFATFTFNSVANAQFGLVKGVAGAMTAGKSKSKEVKLANGKTVSTKRVPIGKTEVMSWIGMDDDETTTNVFKAMVKKQNKYNNDTDARRKVSDENKGEILMVGLLAEDWTYSRTNLGDITSRSIPFFYVMKNKDGNFVTDKFWATQKFNGVSYDAFTVDPIMSGTADANKYWRIIVDWTDEDTAKYSQAK